LEPDAAFHLVSSRHYLPKASSVLTFTRFGLQFILLPSRADVAEPCLSIRVPSLVLEHKQLDCLVDKVAAATLVLQCIASSQLPRNSVSALTSSFFPDVLPLAHQS
jgi:hypothetical protein